MKHVSFILIVAPTDAIITYRTALRKYNDYNH